MRTYETTLILSPILPEAEWEGKIARFENLITSGGGEIVKKEIWGIRKLVYPIRHRLQGYYVFLQYQAPSELPRELDRAIRLDEEVLRHLTVLSKLPKPAPTRTPGPQEAQLEGAK